VVQMDSEVIGREEGMCHLNWKVRGTFGHGERHFNITNTFLPPNKFNSLLSYIQVQAEFSYTTSEQAFTTRC
jgi:hypothetical protein